MRTIVFLLIIAAVTFTSCSKFAKLQKSTDLVAKYDGAMAYYDKKAYDKASILLEEIIPLLKGRKEGETAQFRLSYCYFYMKQYELSSFYFKKFYQTYGRSEQAEEGMYMHAYCLYKDSPNYNLDQTNTKLAIGAMQSFINAYPTSNRKEECNNIIRELRSKLEKKYFENAKQYYKMSNYKAAVVVLENFQQDFPDSDYMEEAVFKKLEMQYYLAKNSIDEKKLERYNETVVMYEDFTEKYPKSEYIKTANSFYDSSVKQIGILKRKEEEKQQKEEENKANEETKI